MPYGVIGVEQNTKHYPPTIKQTNLVLFSCSQSAIVIFFQFICHVLSPLVAMVTVAMATGSSQFSWHRCHGERCYGYW